MLTISLQTHSVWETIYDALPHSSYQNYVLKIPWVPPLKYLRNVVSRVRSPAWKWNLVRTWDFLVWVGPENPPPPPMKIVQELGHWIWVGLEYPPENKNVVRNWTSDSSWSRVSPQIKMWPDWGTLDLSRSRVPPPPSGLMLELCGD